MVANALIECYLTAVSPRCTVGLQNNNPIYSIQCQMPFGKAGGFISTGMFPNADYMGAVY